MKVRYSKFVFFIILLIGYFFVHLYQPTKLPVFADESIYIRWAQLIIDDWRQYLFFPLNDGKTPLFVWSLVPFLLLVKDQLLAGRLLSILIGAAQGCVAFLLSKKIKISTSIAAVAGLISTLTPYWYFHHHLALMDGLLTFWFSCSLLIVIRLITDINQASSWKKLLPDAVCLGLSLGLAILTKIPAFLFLPTIAVAAFGLFPLDKSQLTKSAFWLIIALALALVLFFCLKINPSFSQLFSRGSDFLFSWQDILFN